MVVRFKYYIWFLLLLLNWQLRGQNQSFYSFNGNYSSDYYLYTPYDSPESGQKYPLLVFLHGGAAVSSNPADVLNSGGPPDIINRGRWPSEYPFIVLSPHLPRDLTYNNKNDQLWPNDKINEILNYIVQNYPVDQNRIYITGVSLGGKATWSYAMEFPQKISAIVPFASNADISNVCNLQNVAVWAFHSVNDIQVSYIGIGKYGFSGSYDLIEELKNCNPSYNPRFTNTEVVKEGGHSGWEETYEKLDGYDIFSYFLAHNKSNNSNIKPFVDAGGYDRNIEISNHPIVLNGRAFDSDGEIINYEWTQIGGPMVELRTKDATAYIENVDAGSYVFNLAVTDNHSETSIDDITIDVVNSLSGNVYAITNLNFIHPDNSTELSTMDSYVIDYNTFSNDIVNFMATVPDTRNSRSIVFEVNHNRFFSFSSSRDPKHEMNSRFDWTPRIGTYLIGASCIQGGNNVRGERLFSKRYRINIVDNPHITNISSLSGVVGDNITINYSGFTDISHVIFENNVHANFAIINDTQLNVIVPDEAMSGKIKLVTAGGFEILTSENFIVENTFPKVFYLQSNDNLSSLENWNSEKNGNGISPTSFDLNDQTFIIDKNAILSSDLMINGVNSKVVITNAQLNLNAVLDADMIDLINNSEIILNINYLPEFNELGPESKVKINNDITLHSTEVSNLHLSGSAQIELAVGTIKINGDLTIDNSVSIVGDSDQSIIEISGDLILPSGSANLPARVVFNGTTSQNIILNGSELKVYLFDVSTDIVINDGTITVGGLNGGGINFSENKTFNLGSNTLNVTNSGSINSANSNGVIISNNSIINFICSSSVSSYLYFAPDMNTINSFLVDITGDGQIFLQNETKIKDVLKMQSGSLNIVDDLIFISNMEGTGRLAKVESGSEINGNITMQRYLGPSKVSGWYNLGTNLKDQNIYSWNDNVRIEGKWNLDYPNMQTYNESLDRWIAVKSLDAPLYPGKGYQIYIYDSEFSSGEIVFDNTGEPVIGDGLGDASGSFSIPISKAGSYDGGGWNLISNPYPSPIYWDSEVGWNKSSIINSYYIWDGSLKKYYSYSNGLGTGDLNGIITSGQAFFVKAEEHGHVSLSESVKFDGNANNSLLKKNSQKLILIKAKEAETGIFDECVIRIGDNFSPLFKPQFDALKLQNSYINISSKSIDNKNLSIYNTEVSDSFTSIDLVLNVYQPGRYEWLFNGSYLQQNTVYLVDSFKQEKIQINSGKSYAFEISDSIKYDNRFKLQFFAIEEEIGMRNAFSVYPNPFEQEVHFNLNIDFDSVIELSLFDLIGREIFCNTYKGTKGSNSFKIDFTDLGMKYKPQQFIIFQITTSESMYKGKLIKK